MTTPLDHVASRNRRILIVDDNPSIHEDFRKILAPASSSGSALDAEAAVLFGAECAQAVSRFEIESAYQGDEALAMVRRARDAKRPYAMAFVDMRMPPGWDGLTTIDRIWQVDPEIQTVICTAYSDRSWEEIQSTLETRERWLVMKKPFDKIEALQLAHALTEKWNLGRMAALKFEALESMVAARTQDVVNLHRVKSDFLAHVSHELLTPMNGVSGFLQLIADTALDAEQRLFVQQATESGERLLRLIAQILDFNRSEAGTLPIDRVEFSPHDLLDSVRREHEPAAAAKGLRIEIGDRVVTPERWVGANDVIARVFGLLIDNAIKFTPHGSITLGVAARAPGLAFAIRDTGIGLTPQQLEWIRMPFAQVDGGTTRRSSGIGIGLPLASRLVRAIGGELELGGTPNQGVVATFGVSAAPCSETSNKLAAERTLASR